MDDRTSEPERYDTAAGWQPKPKFADIRKAARRAWLRRPDPDDTMLEVRSASEWLEPTMSSPPTELLASLWRRGEVAVMFGDRGCGKSVFAVQIADAIAKGNSPLNSPKFEDSPRPKTGKPRPPRVLYIDFELSDEKFSSRYGGRSPRGELSMRPRFAFDRAVIDPDFELPRAFTKVSDFLYHSVRGAMVKRENGIVIVDSIHYLLRDTASSTESLNLMKTMRQIALDNNVSILITAPMLPRTRVTRPVTLKDLAAPRCVAELADTVFALCHSTLGPGHRYIKHLASRHAAVIHDASSVLAFELATPPDPIEPPAATMLIERSSSDAAAAAENCTSSNDRRTSLERKTSIESSTPIDAVTSEAYTSSQKRPDPDARFPHLIFLGPTHELQHITDYAAETERRIARENNRLRQLRNPRNTIDMLLSPEFNRHLNGE